MSSAVKVILGVSVLALAAGYAGCDSGSSDDGGTAGSGPQPVAGSSNGTAGSPPVGTAGSPPVGTAGSPPVGTAGAPATGGTTGAAGSGGLPEGIPLTPSAGWVALESNTAMIQGAVFSFADDTSKVGLVDNLMDATATKACISGTAAKVDLMCTPVAPATDCYGTFWGAAIGMNLNQAIDPVTEMGGDPAPYDASAYKGFAFVIDGNTVPAPGSFRFKVENAAGEYCNTKDLKIKVGVNTVLFSDLTTECWMPTATSVKANTPAVQSTLLKISWQVVTNTSATVPFDFCVSDIRALPN